MTEAWWPDWRGDTVVIAASGPSQRREDLDLAHGRAKIMAINSTWQITPFADVLYACDNSWWELDEPGYGQPAMRDFCGLLVSGSSHTTRAHHMAHREVSEAVYGVNFGDGGNSAYQALNIAALWGAARILLTGVDCMLPGHHWHGAHSTAVPLAVSRQSTMDKWLLAFGKIAPLLAAKGVEVINCSRVTALTAFLTDKLENVL